MEKLNPGHWGATAFRNRDVLEQTIEKVNEIIGRLERCSCQDAAKAAEEGGDSLPAQLPYAEYLIAQGITRLADVPRTQEELVALDDIGEARASEILNYLNES